MMHTTLDIDKFYAVTAYESRPHTNAPHVDYFRTAAEVAHRVRECMEELGCGEKELSERARVPLGVIRSLCSNGLAPLPDARAVFDALGMRVSAYPSQMVRMSL